MNFGFMEGTVAKLKLIRISEKNQFIDRYLDRSLKIQVDRREEIEKFYRLIDKQTKDLQNRTICGLQKKLGCKVET